MINFQLRNRAALTLSKPKMPVLLLLSPLPHYMWFGEKASHSWFQFSCLLKEAEYPCMFIDALDSQLVRLTPNLKSPLDCNGSSLIIRVWAMVESLQLFSLAIICQNLFYSMQKTFEAHWWRGPPYNSYSAFFLLILWFGHLAYAEKAAWGDKVHSTFSSHSTRGEKIIKECAIFSLHNCCHRFLV